MSDTLKQNVQTCWEKWQALDAEAINKQVCDIVYGNIEGDYPMVSNNNPNKAAVTKLIDDLKHLGFVFTIEALPRSILSQVSYKDGDITLAPMPAHKGVCLLVLALDAKIREARDGQNV